MDGNIGGHTPQTTLCVLYRLQDSEDFISSPEEDAEEVVDANKEDCVPSQPDEDSSIPSSASDISSGDVTSSIPSDRWEVHHVLKKRKVVCMVLDLEIGGDGYGILELSAKSNRVQLKRGECCCKGFVDKIDTGRGYVP